MEILTRLDALSPREESQTPAKAKTTGGLGALGLGRQPSILSSMDAAIADMVLVKDSEGELLPSSNDASLSHSAKRQRVLSSGAVSQNQIQYEALYSATLLNWRFAIATEAKHDQPPPLCVKQAVISVYDRRKGPTSPQIHFTLELLKAATKREEEGGKRASPSLTVAAATYRMYCAFFPLAMPVFRHLDFSTLYYPATPPHAIHRNLENSISTRLPRHSGEAKWLSTALQSHCSELVKQPALLLALLSSCLQSITSSTFRPTTSAPLTPPLPAAKILSGLLLHVEHQWYSYPWKSPVGLRCRAYQVERPGTADDDTVLTSMFCHSWEEGCKAGSLAWEPWKTLLRAPQSYSVQYHAKEEGQVRRLITVTATAFQCTGLLLMVLQETQDGRRYSAAFERLMCCLPAMAALFPPRVLAALLYHCQALLMQVDATQRQHHDDKVLYIVREHVEFLGPWWETALRLDTSEQSSTVWSLPGSKWPKL